MIKLIAFDLDGVLVDSRKMHYEALNMALATIDPEMIIKKKNIYPHTMEERLRKS